MSDYNIDDILNANDSDEDIDTLSVDLEKLLDDDDDDDDDDDILISDANQPVDLHLYSDSDDEGSNKNDIQEMPPRPSELFAHDTFDPNSESRNVDPELDDLLKEDLDDVVDRRGDNSPALPHSSTSSSLNYSNASNNHLRHNYHVSPLHTLELAEKRENRHMYTGDKDTVFTGCSWHFSL